MGIFATVFVDETIELPHFPEEIERGQSWQSKRGIDQYGGPYRITAEGRLEEKQYRHREKTADEKQSEAEKWGCDSWEEYVHVYEEADNIAFPEELDWDKEEDGYDDSPPTMKPSEEIVEEEYWSDCNKHGSFEFHEILKRDPQSTEEISLDETTIERDTDYKLDVFIEYEARFTNGALDEIVFMGSRGFGDDDPIDHALEQIEDWRDWREENPDNE